jgi:hypothetical protein
MHESTISREAEQDDREDIVMDLSRKAAQQKKDNYEAND